MVAKISSGLRDPGFSCIYLQTFFKRTEWCKIIRCQLAHGKEELRDIYLFLENTLASGKPVLKNRLVSAEVVSRGRHHRQLGPKRFDLTASHPPPIDSWKKMSICLFEVIDFVSCQAFRSWDVLWRDFSSGQVMWRNKSQHWTSVIWFPAWKFWHLWKVCRWLKSISFSRCQFFRVLRCFGLSIRFFLKASGKPGFR